MLTLGRGVDIQRVLELCPTLRAIAGQKAMLSIIYIVLDVTGSAFNRVLSELAPIARVRGFHCVMPCICSARK